MKYYVCYICKKRVNRLEGKHVYRCAEKNNIKEKDKNELRIKFYIFNFPFISKKFWIDTYENKRYSLPDYSKKYNFPYSLVDFCLKYYKIKARTIEEANQEPGRLIKYKNTCLKKYGVENVSQTELVKTKKKETFLEHYGVDNIWKSKNYYKWLHKYMLKKYGAKSVPNLHGNSGTAFNSLTEEEKRIRIKKLHKGYKLYWDNLSDEEKNKIIKKRCRKIVKHFNSKLECRVEKILKDLKIKYIRSFWIAHKSYDFRIIDTNIVIEVQGNYWHANPEIYNPDDVLNYPEAFTKAEDIWEKDYNKLKTAEKYAYQIKYLWEYDLNKMNDSDISNIILGYLK